MEFLFPDYIEIMKIVETFPKLIRIERNDRTIKGFEKNVENWILESSISRNCRIL